MNTLTEYALDVLNTPDAAAKAEKTRAHTNTWRVLNDAEKTIGHARDIPERPERPDKPELLMPRDMPKRKKAGTDKNKIALLHALAHIELNAIDLAWDIIARFSYMANENTPEAFSLPIKFYEDWLKVADDEAKHFLMLNDRLSDFDATYGDLPAHDGMWDSAIATADDFAARLAIVPMVLEARGLDVTPGMIKTMKHQEDEKTAAMLQIILDDEVTHVAAGTVWFKAWCEYHNLNIETEFQRLVRKYFNGVLKKPFNDPKRYEAGMLQHWYEPLVESV